MPIRHLLCLFFCVFASTPLLSASANEKWYEVEVILFSNTNINNYDAELWQDSPGYPKIQNNISLYSEAELFFEEYSGTLPPYFMKAEFEGDNKETLNKYARRLNKSSKYQLLFHHAWRQQLSKKAVFLTDAPNTDPIAYENEVLSPDELNSTVDGESNNNDVTFIEEQTPEELLLSALLEEEKDFSQPLTHLPFFISEFDQIELLDDIRNTPVPQHTDLSYEGPPFHAAYGNFTLTKGRYLHMSVDFLFRGEPYTPKPNNIDLTVKTEIIETTENENEPFLIDDDFQSTPTLTAITAIDDTKPIEAKSPISGFRIKDAKRVRLNRIYYFDHPLFGIVVRIIRHTPS